MAEKESARRQVATDESTKEPVGKGRPTPGKRTREEESHSGNWFTRFIANTREYFSDVRTELQKVTWPTREDAIRLTRIVLITLIVAALVLGAINFGFSQLVRFGITTPIVFVVLFAAVTGVAFYVLRRDTSGRSGY